MYLLKLDIAINGNLYVRDPQATKLGRKIIKESVLIIDAIGLEQFTFKKLAAKINSTETSIYRYFENKHQVFVYLLNWYWEWVWHRLEFNNMNITNPVDKLKIAMGIISDVKKRNTELAYIDEECLHRIVVMEGAKGYHHKLVEEDNKEGFFLAYKKLCAKLASYIEEINPQYPYPKAVASMLIETANNNLYFAEHLPRLTDLDGKRNDITLQVEKLLETIVFKLLE